MISRRYWPHCDDAACRLVSLVAGLRRQRVVPTVFTPRYASSWPSEMDHCEVRMVRPIVAPKGEWSIGRYLRGVTKWMREHLPAFDLVYCDSMRDEASAAVSVAHQLGIPSVVRCGTLAGEDDLVWQSRSRAARRVFTKCAEAGAIIAPRATTQQSLLAAGVRAGGIVRIADGVGPGIARTAPLQKAARLALSEINADLCVPIDGRVILCASRMVGASGVLQLCQQIGPVLEQYPNDRVWLIGDGPARTKIYAQLKQLGAHHAAFMPGSFDHVEDLVQASDLFVLPSASDALEYYWPAAIAGALPSVVADSPDTRGFAGSNFGLLSSFRPEQDGAITRAILDTRSRLEQATEHATRMRAQMFSTVPFSQTIDRHLQLFQRLVSREMPAAGATG